MILDSSKTFFFQTFRLLCPGSVCFIAQFYFIFISQTDAWTFHNYVLVQKIHGSFNNSNYLGPEAAKLCHHCDMIFSHCEILVVGAKNACRSLIAFFSQMWHKHWRFSWVDHWFLPTLPWMPFLVTLILNVESRIVTLAEATEPLSSLNNILGSFKTSYMSCHFDLRECCQAGDFWEDSSLPPVFSFGPDGSHCGLQGSANLRNIFLTLCRLIHCKDFAWCGFYITAKFVKDLKPLIVTNLQSIWVTL